MSGLAALGAIAGGVSQGLERGQMMQARQQGMDRQRKADEEADRISKLNREAEQAGIDYMRQQEANQAQPEMPDDRQYGQDGMPQVAPQVAPKKPWMPSDKDRFGASNAYINALFKQGRRDEGLKRMVADEQQLGPLRQKAIQAEMARFKATDDLSGLLKVYDDLAPHDDSTMRFVGKGLDGKYNVIRRNEVTKKEEQLAMSADDIIASAMALADPRGYLEHSWKEKLELFKRGSEEQEQKNRLALESAKQGGQVSLDDAKTKNDMDRDAANRKSMEKIAAGNNAATLGAAKIRDGNDGIGGRAARAADTRLLREERLSVEGEAKRLETRLETAKPSERPAIQARLDEADARVRKLSEKIAEYGDDTRGSKPGEKAPPTNLLKPGVNTKFKNGQVWTLRNGKPEQVQ